MGACRVDVVAANGATGTLIFSDDFTSGSPTGWTTYGTVSSGTLAVVDGAWKGVMAAGVNDTTVYATKSVAASNLSELYISFRAKMPASKHGIKFCKVFGQQSGGGYANCTFGLEYQTGAMKQVSFGDGTSVGNDTAQVINLDGSSPPLIGRSYGSATVLTPQNAFFSESAWGSGWHDFKLRVKFNSGTTAENEIADGEFYVEIDGVVYVNATGLFNRHYSNLPISHVSLWNFTTSDPPSDFELWYDDFRLSTGGFA